MRTRRARHLRAAVVWWGALAGGASHGAQDAPPGDPAPEQAAPAPATLPAPREAKRDPGPGDEVIVTLTSGERLIGRLVARTEKETVLTIGAVDVRVAAGEIERVTVQRPLGERYREMRRLIDDTDVARLLLLAEWLRGNGLLDEAAAELDLALRVEPTNVEASRLREMVTKQIELRERSGRRGAGAPGVPERGPDDAPRPLPAPSESGGFPLLSPEQVNLVKVFEIDLNRPPKFVIERGTVERLLQRYGGHALIPTTREGREAFFRLDPLEVLNVMFRVQARDLYGEVRVQGNPESMRQFRDNVHRGWLINSCAAPGCHGDGGGGRAPATSSLALFNRKSTAEQSVYSNYLILERHRLADGAPLIDYDKPDMSPLLQMGLPRTESARPHPDVRGWAPVFRTMDDQRYRQAVEWIKSMYQPRPEIPVEYPPKPATPAPAPEPVVR